MLKKYRFGVLPLLQAPQPERPVSAAGDGAGFVRVHGLDAVGRVAWDFPQNQRVYFLKE